MNGTEQWEEAAQPLTSMHQLRNEYLDAYRRTKAHPRWCNDPFFKVGLVVMCQAEQYTDADGRVTYQLIDVGYADIASYAHVDAKDAGTAMRVLEALGVVRCWRKPTRTQKGWWTFTMRANTQWQDALVYLTEAKRSRKRGPGQQTELARAERRPRQVEAIPDDDAPAAPAASDARFLPGHMTPLYGSCDPVGENPTGSHDPSTPGHMTRQDEIPTGSHDPHFPYKGVSNKRGEGSMGASSTQPQTARGEIPHQDPKRGSPSLPGPKRIEEYAEQMRRDARRRRAS